MRRPHKTREQLLIELEERSFPVWGTERGPRHRERGTAASALYNHLCKFRQLLCRDSGRLHRTRSPSINPLLRLRRSIGSTATTSSLTDASEGRVWLYTRGK